MVFGIVSCLLFLVANIRCANADIAADGLAMAALAEAFPRLTTLIGEQHYLCLILAFVRKVLRQECEFKKYIL